MVGQGRPRPGTAWSAAGSAPRAPARGSGTARPGCARVQARGRLVEEQHLRPADQARGQVEAPPHAARVGLDRTAGRTWSGRSAQAWSSRRESRLQLADHDQVGPPGEVVVERRVLPGHPAPYPGRVGDHIRAEHLEHGDRRSRASTAHRGRLPRAVRLEQPEHASSRDRQVEPRQRVGLPRTPARSFVSMARVSCMVAPGWPAISCRRTIVRCTIAVRRTRGNRLQFWSATGWREGSGSWNPKTSDPWPVSPAAATSSPAGTAGEQRRFTSMSGDTRTAARRRAGSARCPVTRCGSGHQGGRCRGLGGDQHAADRQELNAGAMSLYWHVASKDELLDRCSTPSRASSSSLRRPGLADGPAGAGREGSAARCTGTSG